MKPNNNNLLLLLMLFVFTAGAQQEAQSNSFSLQQAVDYALKNSPSQKNAEMDVQSADYRRKEITGMGLPQVSGSFDFKDYLRLPVQVVDANAFSPAVPKGTYTTLTFGVQYGATAGLNVSQLIFSSDYIFGLRASSEYMKLAEMSAIRTKADVVAAVSKAYYNVLINRERISLLDANISRLQKTFDDTKAVWEQGLVEKIDMERLEVALNNLKSEKSKIDRLIGLTEAMLKFQMGYKISDPIVLTDKIDMGAEPQQQLGAQKFDIMQRPDYKLMQHQQYLLDLDVKRLKAGYLPTLAAYGAFQLNTSRPTAAIFENDKTNPVKQWYRVGIIGLTMNVNIFDGLQRHYRIQQSKITAEKNANTINALVLGAELEATSASIAFDNAIVSSEVQKKNMELAQHVYDVAQKKYLSGIGTNMEVLTAETALKEAQTNYLNALYDMVVAKIDYQKATGTLVK